MEHVGLLVAVVYLYCDTTEQQMLRATVSGNVMILQIVWNAQFAL